MPHLPPPSRPFDLVCENLRKIGALPIDEYLAAIKLRQIPSDVSAEAFSPCQEATILPSTDSSIKNEHISRLEEAVESAFPDFTLENALRFDIARRSGDPNGIQCILTIARPGGAKVQAARIATEKGAVQFILNGDVKMEEDPESSMLEFKDDMLVAENVLAEEGLPTGEAEAAVKMEAEVEEEEKDVNVAAIESACKEWRPGNYPPDWMFYHTQEPTDPALRWGAVLRVHLAAPRIYATDMVYLTAADAKTGAAKLAIKQGLIADIQNIADPSGKPTPSAPPPPPPRATPTNGITLETWFATLPRPLPSDFDFGDKTATEIGASAMLNTWITKARGARLKVDYFWPFVQLSEKSTLTGCVLRIDRAGEVRSYLVEPVFANRRDARNAVSLLALSQGAGEYIRQIGLEVDNKISPRMRSLVDDQIYPMLGRKGAGETHTWTFHMDRDAYGCTLVVAFEFGRYEYATEPEYRTKADAKLGAAILAAEHGLIELLRFGGEPAPADYKPFWPTFQAALRDQDGTVSQGKPLKRKRAEGELSASHGRRKRKRILAIKMEEEAAAASNASEASGSGAVQPKPAASEPSRSAEPQQLTATAVVSLSEKALGKKPATTGLTSSISGGVSLGTANRAKTKAKKPRHRNKPKAKASAIPIPIPQGYERTPPLTSIHPHPPAAHPAPPPSPAAPLPQLPPGHAGHTHAQRSIPPSRYEFDYGHPPPRPPFHEHPHPPHPHPPHPRPPQPHPPPTFGAPRAQHYPFTAPLPSWHHMYPAPPPDPYSYPYGARTGYTGPPRTEPPPPQWYGYGPGPSQPPPHHAQHMGDPNARWGGPRR
ncbi:hypothetical protein FPV67DRAFT_218446 [Lyophyllum atratum]|nr:hypothetical protein FPV67DRAFT_218446 [Lyophyllum atratum]